MSLLIARIQIQRPAVVELIGVTFSTSHNLRFGSTVPTGVKKVTSPSMPGRDDGRSGALPCCHPVVRRRSLVSFLRPRRNILSAPRTLHFDPWSSPETRQLGKAANPRTWQAARSGGPETRQAAKPLASVAPLRCKSPSQLDNHGVTVAQRDVGATI